MAHLKYSIAGLVVTLMLVGCTTPRYYLAQSFSQPIRCFSKDSIGKYMWAGLSEDHFVMALKRINGSFASEKGIYRWLFEKQFTGDFTVCGQDPPLTQRNAHVSAFSQTAPPQPLQPKEPMREQQSEQEKNPMKGHQSQEEKKPKKDQQSETQKDRDERSDLVQQVWLVISSYLYTLNASDRLEKVYTLITPIDAGVEFLAARGIAIPALIEFGKFTKTTDIGLTQAGVSVPTPLGVPIPLQAKTTRSLERKIARQYAIQNVEIFPLRNILLVSEDGGPATADIGGNSVTEVTFRIPTSLCTYVSIFEKKRMTIGSTSDGQFEIKHSCYVERVPALVASIAVARIVTFGGNTVEEDDDLVELVPFKTGTVTDLWSNPKRLYGLDVGNDKVPVVFSSNKGLKGRILFDNLDHAIEFRKWLLEEISQGHAQELIDGNLEWKAANVKVAFHKQIDPRRVAAELFRICEFGLPRPDLSEWAIPSIEVFCAPSSM